MSDRLYQGRWRWRLVRSQSHRRILPRRLLQDKFDRGTQSDIRFPVERLILRSGDACVGTAGKSVRPKVLPMCPVRSVTYVSSRSDDSLTIRRMALSIGFQDSVSFLLAIQLQGSGFCPGETLSSLNTPAFLGHTDMPIHPGALRVADNYAQASYFDPRSFPLLTERSSDILP
jgi:hypothetical protein